MYYTTSFHLAHSDALCVLSVSFVLAVRIKNNIAFTFSLVFLAAVRKDIRPEATFTCRSPTLNKHNHCSPQRHTILLLHFLLSSWPQSAKTYDLKKHVLSYLLHLTNTIIAVRKDIQYSLSIFSCLRGRNPQRHTTF